MDPSPFVRILVGGVALKSPGGASAAAAAAGVHPTPASCFCKIRLSGLPPQTADVALDPSLAQSHAAAFDLRPSDLSRLSSRPLLFAPRRPLLKLSFYAGSRSASCAAKHGRLLGKLSLPLDLPPQTDAPAILHSGLLPLRKSVTPAAEAHVTVRFEPDPRYVFEFGCDPECSPQVFQVQGNMRQPVFTCKFGFRSYSQRCPSSVGRRSWLGSFGSWRERPGKERKGWAVTIHDLSGSPVAMASMVTPFVASPGTDQVSRASPGAWLILRPGDGTWKPWGRLEAWRVHRGMSDAVGYRFELLPDATASGSAVVMAESTLSAGSGGRFVLDQTGSGQAQQPKAGRTLSRSATTSPGCSPRCMSRRFSGHFGHGLWPFYSYKGFVMSSTVEGEGRSSKPTVEIGAQNVACAEDAAVFIALAAAMDLCMDACRLFSHKLRKELNHLQDLSVR